MNLFLDRLQNIKNVGAIAASSRFLARKIITEAALETHTVIAEIGPGDGVFTKEIAAHITDKQTLFTLEKDTVFFKHMQDTYPEIPHFNVCASTIDQVMEQLSIGSVDCIISSLPRAIFDDTLQKKILDALYDSLSPGGMLLTFGYVHARYLPHAMKFNARLLSTFSHIEESDIVRLNIPPAFVYVCKK